jgi:carbon-monoxide dehydrogenase medium subunit
MTYSPVPEPEWYEPESLQEALRLRSQLGDSAVVVAGGTFTGILVGQRLIRPEAFLHLGSVPGLDRIEHGGEGGADLRLGAMVRHRAVERSAAVRLGWESLGRAFAVVASPRVRNQATVGGVLCDADYASDPPAMFVALGARVVLASPRGTRELAVEDFITGHYSTQLRDDELLTHVVVPRTRARATYLKFRSRSHEDRPCAAVAVTADLEPDGTCRDLRVVAGAVADRPRLLRDACDLARGRRLDLEVAKSIARAYAEGVETLSDVRGSADYRRRVLGVVVRRALEEVLP